MKIMVHDRKCSGCRLCEIVCSLWHLGVVNTEKSAIRIHQDDLDTSLNRPTLCRRCRDMRCINAEEAVEARGRDAFLWDPARAERCPFQALGVFEDKAYHCDLCGGRPRCVTVCTTGALRIRKGGNRMSH